MMRIWLKNNIYVLAKTNIVFVENVSVRLANGNCMTVNLALSFTDDHGTSQTVSVWDIARIERVG